MSSSSGFEELPETHIERMDRLAFEAQQKKELAQIQANRDIKVAKENRKAERTEVWIWLGVAFAVAGVLFSCVYAWWIDVDPKSPEDFRTSEAGREQACIENGGGFVPEDLLVSGSRGICIYPGQRAEVSSE